MNRTIFCYWENLFDSSSDKMKTTNVEDFCRGDHGYDVEGWVNVNPAAFMVKPYFDFDLKTENQTISAAADNYIALSRKLKEDIKDMLGLQSISKVIMAFRNPITIANKTKTSLRFFVKDAQVSLSNLFEAVKTSNKRKPDDEKFDESVYKRTQKICMVGCLKSPKEKKLLIPECFLTTEVLKSTDREELQGLIKEWFMDPENVSEYIIQIVNPDDKVIHFQNSLLDQGEVQGSKKRSHMDLGGNVDTPLHDRGFHCIERAKKPCKHQTETENTEDMKQDITCEEQQYSEEANSRLSEQKEISPSTECTQFMSIISKIVEIPVTRISNTYMLRRYKVKNQLAFVVVLPTTEKRCVNVKRAHKSNNQFIRISYHPPKTITVSRLCHDDDCKNACTNYVVSEDNSKSEIIRSVIQSFDNETRIKDSKTDEQEQSALALRNAMIINETRQQFDSSLDIIYNSFREQARAKVEEYILWCHPKKPKRSRENHEAGENEVQHEQSEAVIVHKGKYNPHVRHIDVFVTDSNNPCFVCDKKECVAAISINATPDLRRTKADKPFVTHSKCQACAKKYNHDFEIETDITVDSFWQEQVENLRKLNLKMALGEHSMAHFIQIEEDIRLNESLIHLYYSPRSSEARHYLLHKLKEAAVFCKGVIYLKKTDTQTWHCDIDNKLVSHAVWLYIEEGIKKILNAVIRESQKNPQLEMEAMITEVTKELNRITENQKSITSDCLQGILSNLNAVASKCQIPISEENYKTAQGMVMPDDTFILKSSQIAFRNAFVDLDKKTTEKLRLDHYVIDTVNLDYKQKEEIPPEIKQRIRDYFISIFPKKDTRKKAKFALATSIMSNALDQRKIYICVGSGANGKTYLFDYIQQLFAPLVTTSQYNILNQNNNASNSANPQLTRLKDARLVLLNEPCQEHQIDSSTVKHYLSNGDTIAARKLYENKYSSYAPHFNIFLLCNNIPDFSNSDNALERRVSKIDFITKFVEPGSKITNLSAKIKDHNILNRNSYEFNSCFASYLIHKAFKYSNNGWVPPFSESDRVFEINKKGLDLFLQNRITISDSEISLMDLEKQIRAELKTDVGYDPTEDEKFTIKALSSKLRKAGYNIHRKKNGNYVKAKFVSEDFST